MAHTEDLIITSTQNRRIVEARKLEQRKHRRRQDRFLVEGLQLLRMALDAGHLPETAFYCADDLVGEQGQALLSALCDSSTRVIQVSHRVLASLSYREAPQGLVCIFPMLHKPLETLRPDPNQLFLVVDRLQDPGNLGTLLRTADAVGASGAALIQPCVDPYDPATVRATMGSLFNVPLWLATNVEDVFERLHGAGLRSVGAEAHGGTLWGDGLWDSGIALVLGNEARGLSPDVQSSIQSWANLPMVGRAESLNVAIAGGIFMYAWLRANSVA